MTWNTKSEVKEQDKPKKVIFKTLKESKETRGIKILSYGNFSTGKTHFALSSTKPVFIIDTENGASPLADKFPDAKVMNICNQDGENVDEKDDVKNFEEFMNTIDYLITLPDEQVGTIVVDSITDIWGWSQAYAKTKIFKIPVEDRFKQMWDWAVPTKLYLKQILKLINKKCNVILCAREAEEYDGPGSPSGRYKPQCQKKTPYWVDVVLHHEFKFINKQISFYAKIEKCRQKGSLIGTIIESPTLDKIIEVLK